MAGRREAGVGPSLAAVWRRLRSPFAGLPVGVVAALVAVPVLWQVVRSDPSHTVTSALLIAGGIGVALVATVATIWYGLAVSRDDR